VAESNRVLWKFTELSQHSDNHGVGSLKARLEVSNGPSSQGTIATQFNCEGTTLSGIELDLVGSGYRLSLVKRRFVSGKWLLCEWGTGPIFIEIALRKSSKNDEEKSKTAPRYNQPLARKSSSKLPVTS